MLSGTIWKYTMSGTPVLEDVYDAYTNIRGFRHYIRINPYNSDVIEYKIGLDTEYLDERDRARDDIREGYGIPSHVMHNGNKYTFKLTVFSIRETHTDTHELAQVYDGGYRDEHAFIAFDIHEAFAQSDEWNWRPSLSGGGCSECGLTLSGKLPDGGTVVREGSKFSDDDRETLCVACGLQKIGHEDLIQSLPSTPLERGVIGDNVDSIEEIPNALWGMKGDLKETLENTVPNWLYAEPSGYSWQATSSYRSDVTEYAENSPFGYGVAVFRFALNRSDDMLPASRRQTPRGMRKTGGVRPKPAPEPLWSKVNEWVEGSGKRRPEAFLLAVEIGPRGGVRDLNVFAGY